MDRSNPPYAAWLLRLWRRGNAFRGGRIDNLRHGQQVVRPIDRKSSVVGFWRCFVGCSRRRGLGSGQRGAFPEARKNNGEGQYSSNLEEPGVPRETQSGIQNRTRGLENMGDL